MKAPDWYAAWRHAAVHDLMDKQQQARLEFRVDDWPSYNYDAQAGTLVFSEGDVPKVIAEIQIVGTTGKSDWLWSWANDHWADCCIDEMYKVRDFGIEHGIEQLSSEYLEDDDLNGLGWAMTAVAARLLGAVGAYRPIQGTGAVFFVCKSFKFVT